jgi:hypothetical protein
VGVIRAKLNFSWFEVFRDELMNWDYFPFHNLYSLDVNDLNRILKRSKELIIDVNGPENKQFSKQLQLLEDLGRCYFDYESENKPLDQEQVGVFLDPLCC